MAESTAECIGQVIAEEAREPRVDWLVGATSGKLGESESAERGEGIREQPSEERQRRGHAQVDEAGQVGDAAWGKIDIAASGSIEGAGDSNELVVDAEAADEVEDGGAFGSESAWAAFEEDAAVIEDDEL